MNSLPRTRAVRLVHLCLALLAGGALQLCVPSQARGSEIAVVEDPLGADAARAANARATASAPNEDEVILISTRGMGLRCEPALMAEGLRCERRDASGAWRQESWHDTLARCSAEPLPTLIYVHGNRVPVGGDKAEALSFYRWFASRKPADAPVRFVIWSWPSAQVPGRLKDYEVKAARCRPCGWQLAWAIDQLPPETPLSIVGYSYGARLTTSALHILGGGTLGTLALDERAHPQRPGIRVALLAAAVDAHWLRPEGRHGRALSQCEELVLVNNQLDPAMRFYPMSPVGHRNTALGYAGVPGRRTLGDVSARIHPVDMTNAVGRHHALSAYLTASGPLAQALEPLLPSSLGAYEVQHSVARREAAE